MVLRLRALLDRARLLGLEHVLELAGRRLHLRRPALGLAAVHRAAGRDLLRVTGTDERSARHVEAVAGALLSGAPGAAVAGDLAVLVLVDVFAEVVDVVGALRDREVVAGDLLDLPVDGLLL